MTTPVLASRVKKARRTSTCPVCRRPIFIGQLIARTGFWAHAACVIERNRNEGKQHDNRLRPVP